MCAVRRHPVENNAVMLATAVTRDRAPIFRDPIFAREAVDTLYRVRLVHPFLLFGFVIMPDHCHLLLYLNAPLRIRTVMKQFKCGVSHNIGGGPLWQHRYDLQIIRKTSKALQYIHSNPVKAGLVKVEHEYPWSSGSGIWEIDPIDCE